MVPDTAALVEVGRSSIHDNGTTADHLGIDLGADGVTGEDTTDGIQDFPVLTSAATRSSDTDVTGIGPRDRGPRRQDRRLLQPRVRRVRER